MRSETDNIISFIKFNFQKTIANSKLSFDAILSNFSDFFKNFKFVNFKISEQNNITFDIDSFQKLNLSKLTPEIRFFKPSLPNLSDGKFDEYQYISSQLNEFYIYSNLNKNNNNTIKSCNNEDIISLENYHDSNTKNNDAACEVTFDIQQSNAIDSSLESFFDKFLSTFFIFSGDSIILLLFYNFFKILSMYMLVELIWTSQ